MDLLARVGNTIERYGMIPSRTTLAAAVSGGADSVVMLHALTALAPGLGIAGIVVCHLDHGLRGEESRRDYEFTKRLAEGLGHRFEGASLDPGVLGDRSGESLQAAARTERYNFLEEAAKRHGAERIALGHTLDDRAETVLMRLLKGAGLDGLAGIPPVRGRFIRPLIETSRGEVEAWAREAGIEFVVDSSNLSTRYLRNEIRLKLIPELRKRYNPNITETLARTSRLLSIDEDFIEREAEDAEAGAVTGRDASSVGFDRQALLKLHPAVSSRVVLRAAALIAPASPLYSVHIEACLDLIRGERPNASLDLPGGVRLVREYESVRLVTGGAAEPGPYIIELRVPGVTRIPGTSLSLVAEVLDTPPESLSGDPATAYFDFSAITGPVEVRSPSPGDKLVPFGMKGHKKLKDVFIDEKVPAGARRTLPLIVSGGNILWAAGVKRSDLLRVTDRTTRVLRIELREEG